MTALRIYTGFKVFETTNTGEIIRLDIPNFRPSKNWTLFGIKHVRKNITIWFKDIPAWLKTNPDFLYKNKKPQWQIIDYDHGTFRIWASTPLSKIYIKERDNYD